MPSAYFDFLDVGMGDCTFIRAPGGELLLVDFGSLKSARVGPPDALKYMAPYLRERLKIDLLVLTHCDADHYNQLHKIFRRFPTLEVKTLIHGGDIYDYRAYGNYDISSELGARIKRYEAPYSNTTAEPNFTFSGLKIWILAANYPSIFGETNDTSIVLKFEYGSGVIILPGDATQYTERMILEKFPDPNLLRCDLLKLPHHGSDTSSSDAWRERLSPEGIVISADTKSNYGLPKKQVVSAYQKFLKPANVHNFVWYDKSLASADKFRRISTKSQIFGTLDNLQQGCQITVEVRIVGQRTIFDFTTTAGLDETDEEMDET